MAKPVISTNSSYQALVAEAASQIAARVGVESFDIAVVLGSGWGATAELLGETLAVIAANEISGFSVSGVAGHSGTIRAVRLENSKHVLVLGARTHLYEGRGTDAVVHGVRVAHELGVKSLVLTNGCGGINESFAAGDVVAISDHINLTGVTPLVGANFIDMSEGYSLRMRGIAGSCADGLGQKLGHGVYVQFRGPQYETPAEIRMAKTLGGDLVGMSTAIETIAARALGLEVLGLSLVTNLAAGISPNPLSHTEVLEAGRLAEPRISALLARIVNHI